MVYSGWVRVFWSIALASSKEFDLIKLMIVLTYIEFLWLYVRF